MIYFIFNYVCIYLRISLCVYLSVGEGSKCISVCVSVCGYIHKISGAHRDQKKALDPQELELLWLVRLMTWALRSELSL